MDGGGADGSTEERTSGDEDVTEDEETRVPEENDGDTVPSTDSESVPEEEESGWRSLLYPPDWVPGFADGEGRFLHDFSYAGYRNGEVSLPDWSLEGSWDVVEAFGADPTGAEDSTGPIQAAIDAAAQDGGGVVFFPEGLYRLDGTLQISTSGIVLRGVSPEVSRLFFSKSEGMSYTSHIRFAGSNALEDWPLELDGESGSTEVFLADASGLEEGQDIAIGWVITDAFVAEHDMTGTWGAFNGTWQPFFLREIVAIDLESTPHRVEVDVPLRYRSRVSNLASIRLQSGLLSECGVENLGVSNAISWSAAWAHNQVHVLGMENVKDSWVRNVASFSSPLAPTSGNGTAAHLQSSGLLVKLSKRVSVVESTLQDAENIGGGGTATSLKFGRVMKCCFGIVWGATGGTILFRTGDLEPRGVCGFGWRVRGESRG